MDERQRQYLEAMGIQVWMQRDPIAESAPVAAREEVPPPAPVPPSQPELPAQRELPQQPDLPPQPPMVAADPKPLVLTESSTTEDTQIAQMDWAPLKALVDVCTRCPELVANRTQTVFGVGNREAEWMVIGEAPGADEDKQGEPFVGRAGQLLNEMLRAMAHPRETVFIANVLKCRPPNNRDPKPEEAHNCEPYLKRQIALIKPRIILAVGRIAAQNLLKTDTPIGKLRGRVHTYEGTPLVVTYHPAYLLRSPLEKRKAWDDLRLALKTYRELSPR